MRLNYNVTGEKRKELVSLIANFTGCKARYKGVPSCAYEVDYFTIDRNGCVEFDDRADSEVIERLIEMLYDNSFVAETDDAVQADEPETLCGCIFIPRTQLSENGLDNLKKLITAKGDLIKKALGVEELTITEDIDNYGFPWIADGTAPDDVRAIMDFVTALCKLANTLKRINKKETAVENEKYAFRCFLLRLGFIGEEYKRQRKTLLRRLRGSSAFKNGRLE